MYGIDERLEADIGRLVSGPPLRNLLRGIHDNHNQAFSTTGNPDGSESEALI